MVSDEGGYVTEVYKPWQDKELMKEWLPQLNNYEAADKFGGDEKRYRLARRAFGIPKFDPKAVDEPKGDATLCTVEEKVARDKEVIRLKRERDESRQLYREGIKKSVLTEQVLDLAEQIMPTLKCEYTPPTIIKREGKTIESAVLATGDWHIDSTVDLEVMEGLNEYNLPIVARRVETMVDSTLNLILGHHSGTDFDDMYVLDVGDGITGPLHEENKYTNSIPPFQAITICAELKVRSLLDLAANVPHVTYIGVPGNHWRYTNKVSWTMPTETSDWLINKMVQKRLMDAPNIDVIVPNAWSAAIEIKGHGFSLNHGYSDAKGGFGGISWYSLQKSDAKRTAIDQRLGRDVEYRLYGHIHNEATIGRTVAGQIIVNPSLIGGDPFAKEGLAGTYSDPGQMLWGVHSERGKTWSYNPLTVRERDYNKECRYDDAILIR